MTQLPSPQRYPAPHHIKRLRPKTYSIAVYLVGAVIVLQVVMVISVFWLRAMVVSVNVKPPTSPAGHTSTYQPVPLMHPKMPAVDASGIKRLPGANLGLLTVPSASDEQEQVLTLNEEAHVFIKQNDYQSATDLLLKAEDIDPRHPVTLKNLAETYNLQNDAVRAKVYWQRLVDLGPGLDTIYASALDHVKLLDSSRDSSPLHEPSELARQVYIDSVQKSPVETRDGNAQFQVRTVLMRKDPNMANFDQKKLQPYVIFYQQMPDGTLVPDLGQHKGAFDDTFLFWSGKTSEPFSVQYVMPVSGAPGPNGTKQGKYYGFVIGIYYDKVLQDVRSEPSDLMSRMALPREIE